MAALPQPPKSRLWPFLLWLGVFYAVWMAIVVTGSYWSTLVEHWGIALAMVAGSYCAGSTPMGGGTVGFPILVLLFDEPASLGRNFSLAIQSIGMVSATVFILVTRTQLARHLLGWAMVGSLFGTVLGAVFVAPHATDLFVKLLFAVIWASFGIMTFVKIQELSNIHGITRTTALLDREAGLLVGIVGGVVASMTGVGIDMIIYAVLVLLERADLKIAIPTSVVLMAFTSVVGLFTNMALGTVGANVFGNWLAAAPVVAIGAPFGAWVVSRVGRVTTLMIVSVLCVAQFIWTCIHEHVGGSTLALALGGVLLCNAAFHLLHAKGRRLAEIDAQRAKRDPMPSVAGRPQPVPGAVSD